MTASLLIHRYDPAIVADGWRQMEELVAKVFVSVQLHLIGLCKKHWHIQLYGHEAEGIIQNSQDHARDESSMILIQHYL